MGMAKSPQPTEYKIPSRSWGITADEAGDILVTAKEVKNNKALYKAAIKHLKQKAKRIDEVI